SREAVDRGLGRDKVLMEATPDLQQKMATDSALATEVAAVLKQTNATRALVRSHNMPSAAQTRMLTQLREEFTRYKNSELRSLAGSAISGIEDHQLLEDLLLPHQR